MSWLLPTELLPVAALLALVLAWPRLQVPRSAARLFGQVVAITVGCIALVWVGWLLLWWMEPRW